MKISGPGMKYVSTETCGIVEVKHMGKGDFKGESGDFNEVCLKGDLCDCRGVFRIDKRHLG